MDLLTEILKANKKLKTALKTLTRLHTVRYKQIDILIKHLKENQNCNICRYYIGPEELSKCCDGCFSKSGTNNWEISDKIFNNTKVEPCCKKCIHWTSASEMPAVDSAFLPKGYGECSNDIFVCWDGCSKVTKESLLILTQIVKTYDACFWTRAEFCCVGFTFNS